MGKLVAQAAGIVLAGGRSSRMGTPKAALEWHGSTLLRRVVGVVGRRSTARSWSCARPGQALPDLPDGVEVADDAREGRGPLQGLAAGLAAVRDRADAAYASSTDVPLLHPRFIRRVLAALDDDVDVVLPEVGGFRHPLAAAYPTELADVVERLIASDRMRPAYLFESCRVRRLDAEALLADPALAAGRPRPRLAAQPQRARRLRGSPRPPRARGDGLRPRGTAATEHGRWRARSRCGRDRGEAAGASGLSLDVRIVASVNGDQVTRDPHAPLAAGDSVAFLSTDAGD